MSEVNSAAVPFPRTRWQAGLVHLAASVVVGLAILMLIRFAWYPEVLFYIAGGANLAMLIVGCDVIIGPLLTTIVFKRGKKTLKFDLAVILLLQIAAMVYGTYVLYTARPVVLIAAGDRIYAVGYNQLDPEYWKRAPPTVKLSAWGPTQYSVSKPFDPILQNQMIDELLRGNDLHMLPWMYRPYADGRQTLLNSARLDAQGQAFVPLVARKGNGMAYLDSSGDLKQMKEGDPWETAKPVP
ncbi:hypothetical protein C7S18_18965 [Ahniella affigens]|uniref:Type IV pilin accessory protein n=1 Tax=Ahniella affigens TaxID=2021234 RepID=A0A2P1PWB7_9GAMM|nr:hypothetical protein [Ahniella affigens]AVP99122.1 hypothetical protein C7S18_18965 [Ahniella affigens]